MPYAPANPLHVCTVPAYKITLIQCACQNKHCSCDISTLWRWVTKAIAWLVAMAIFYHGNLKKKKTPWQICKFFVSHSCTISALIL